MLLLIKNQNITMIRFLFFFYPIFILAQNIDMYISLIDEGQTSSVKEKLPELISKYPNSAGVIYLQALLTRDGMKSLDLYNEIIEKFPRSSFSDDASVKLGEYFYARGLYSQACKSLSQFPRKHPRYHDMQRVIDLLVSSFQAVGQNDSAKYYLSIYQGMFPYLDVDKYGINTSNLNPPISQKEKFSDKRSPYVIQIGAFSSLKNAKRLKLQANQIGHEVEIVQVETKDRTLNAVRVIRYNTKNAAEKVGQNIKRKLGVDYRVLYRPIKG